MLLAQTSETGLQLARVQLYGLQPHLTRHIVYPPHPTDGPLSAACSWITPPVDPLSAGIGQVSRRTGWIERDGALLPSVEQAVVIGESRDCPYGVIENRVTEQVVLVHAGRHSLIHGVLQNALQAIGHDSHPDATHVFVTGGIRAPHFRHERNPSLVQPFLQRYGHSVITNWQWLTLDLFRVIRLELARAGVPPAHIRDDGHCTYCHPGLGSKRADEAAVPQKTLPNRVRVQRHP